MNLLTMIFSLLRIAAIISRTQILTHPNHLKLPVKIRLLGYFLTVFFYPLGLIIRPKKDFGSRLSSCFEKLGPIYVKFGQALSTRPDLIGQEVVEKLKYLQDSLPPFPTSVARQIISRSLECNVEELFADFVQEPVAAASISQVHKARLKSGEFVAVKIIRPQIYSKYNNDIKLLYFLAKLATNIKINTKRLRLIEVVEVFRNMMHFELDMRLEASAASEMLDNFKNDPGIYIPKVYWALTSEQVLTTEWVEGTSIYNTEQIIAKNLDPRELSVKIAVMFFNQTYRDGFFHADLHPGNILVKDDGRITLLDFGITGRLSEHDRLAVAEILYGFLNRDYRRVAQVHLRAGYVPKNTNLELFAQSCRAMAEPIFGLPIKDILIGKLLTRLFKLTEDFGMETQPQLLLLQKSMIIIEGIGHSLDHEINMWQLAEPWIKKWAIKNITPEAKFLRVVKRLATELLEKLEE